MSAFEHWVDLPDGGKHCPNHDQTFARGRVCTVCRVAGNPGIEITEIDNEHDQDIYLEEAALDEEAKFWRRGARELWEGTPLERNTAVKAADTGLKFTRLRLEMREKRANREHDRQLIQHERAMAGLRRGN